jgi:hypothetical protein
LEDPDSTVPETLTAVHRPLPESITTANPLAIFDPEKPVQFIYADRLSRDAPVISAGFSFEDAFQLYLSRARREFIAIYNASALDLGIEPKYLLSLDLAMDKLPEKAREYLKKHVQKFIGQLALDKNAKPRPLVWDTQVRAVTRVVRALAEGKRMIIIEAETQSGKSGILILSSMLWQVFCFSNNQKQQSFNISPNSVSISEQTVTDGYEIMTLLYGATFMEAERARPLVTIGAEGYETSNEFRNKKSRGQNFDKIAGKIDRNIENGCQSVLFIDEADEANNLASYLDNLLGPLREDQRDPASKIIKEGRFTSGLVTLVFLTATAYGFSDAEEFEHILVDTGPNYRAMFHIKGHRDGKPRKVIPVLSFGQLDEYLGLHAFADWKDASYARKVHAMDSLIPLLKKGLPVGVFPDTAMMPTHDINGQPWQGGMGTLIRFDLKQDVCDQFCVHLETKSKSYMQRVAILRYWGSYMKSQWLKVPGKPKPVKIEYNTVAEMVEKAIAEGVEQFVIIVAGGARRGDRVPEECAIAVECTKQQSGAIARLQGLGGRMTGHKDTATMLICSERDHREIRDLRRVFHHTGKKAGSGAIGSRLLAAWSYKLGGHVYTEIGNPFKDKVAVRVDREEYPQFEHIFREIDRVVGGSIDWRAQTINKKEIAEWLKDLGHNPPVFKSAAEARSYLATKGLTAPKFPSPDLDKDQALATFPEHCVEGEAYKRTDPTTGKVEYGKYLFWDVFGPNGDGLFSDEFLEVLAFRAGQPILMPGEAQRGTGRSLKTPRRKRGEQARYTHITVGGYATQAKLGIGRRGLTGNRSDRPSGGLEGGRQTRIQGKSGSDLGLDILFEPIGDPQPDKHGNYDPRRFRSRLLTIALDVRDDGERLFRHGELTVDPEVFATDFTHIYHNLYGDVSRARADAAIAAKKGRGKAQKPRAPKPAAPVAPDINIFDTF